VGFLEISKEPAKQILSINQPVDYMARGVKIWMRVVDITRAIGRVALKVKPALGPKKSRAPQKPRERPQIYVFTK